MAIDLNLVLKEELHFLLVSAPLQLATIPFSSPNTIAIRYFREPFSASEPSLRLLAIDRTTRGR